MFERHASAIFLLGGDANLPASVVVPHRAFSGGIESGRELFDNVVRNAETKGMGGRFSPCLVMYTVRDVAGVAYNGFICRRDRS